MKHRAYFSTESVALRFYCAITAPFAELRYLECGGFKVSWQYER
jgi:hypothetical protein